MFSCKTDLEKIIALTSTEYLPTESGKNIEIIFSSNAGVQMVLTTPRLDRYTVGRKYLEMAEGITVVFYDSLMNPRGSIFAKYARHFIDEDLFELRDSIVIVTEINERITTDELFWDRKKKIVFNNSFTTVSSNELISTGEGFEADEMFNQWSFRSPSGTIFIETQEPGESDEDVRGPPRQ